MGLAKLMAKGSGGGLARVKGTGSVYQRESDGRWVATIEAGWTARGARRRITLTAKTQAEVRRKLRDKQAQIARDGLPSPGASDRVTVKAWCEQWLAMTVRTSRPGTFISDRAAVNKWIIATIGHKRLTELTPADVRKLQRAQEDAGGATSSVNRTHGVLNRILTAAVLEGYQVPQRVRETPGVGVGRTDRDAIPLDDALRILQVALARPDATRWVAAMLQGVRPGEARGLTWEQIDLAAGTMTLAWQLQALPYRIPRDRESGFRVPRDFEAINLIDAFHLVRPKTDAGIRVVPLIPWMQNALTEWREVAPANQWGLVWPRADGRPRDAKDDRAAWYEVAEQAGVKIKGRNPLLYENRHTAATLLLAAGVDETTIKAILGHATVLSTKAYLHADQARTRRALESTAAILRLGL